MLISHSIMAHERSSSTQVMAVLSMVSKRFKAMSVRSNRPGSMLGCLTTGTVMEEKKLKRKFKV
jgi:hypothetical protein